MYRVSEKPPALSLDPRVRICMPVQVMEHMQGHTLEAREVFAVLLLDAKHRAICTPYTVSVGSLSAALVHPREVFWPAIKKSAAAIILVHTHPSGELEPSQDDIDLTRRLAEAGELLGIAVLDHVILPPDVSEYLSMREYGCWPI